VTEELREQILQIIREELTINVITRSNYNGGKDGSLYDAVHEVRLMLGAEVISYAWID
jgi:hypothetical protein